jgi:hypothetical protein
MTPMIAWNAEAEQWRDLAYCCPGAPIDRLAKFRRRRIRGQQRQRCDDRHTDEVASMHAIPPVAQTASARLQAVFHGTILCLIMQHIRLQLAGR